MKIAMVSEHASPLATLGGADAGGQNVHVAELARALGARGHEVTVYTRRDSPDLPTRVPLTGNVTVEHLPCGPAQAMAKDDLLPHIPELARHLRVALDDSTPDVVHTHFWMSGLAGLTATAGTDLPVVHTFHALGVVKRRHQHEADTSPAGRLRIEQRIACDADRVIASCRDERREILQLGAPAARVDVVPSGVDGAVFTPDGSHAPGTGRRRLLVVGRLVARKGVEDAVRALAAVPDTELVVAGGPGGDALLAGDPEVDRLRRLAAECGVEDRVRFIGSVSRDEVATWIRSADLVLCLPWYEPFGIVPLEAMACGVPVVATAVGGLLDTVVHGTTGLHVPPHDPAAVARAVTTLLDDAQLRRRMGAAGVARAARYGWASIAAAVEHTYTAAMSAERVSEAVAG
jgi:glycosyltransferase involved in cell wall biosynthesis